MNELLKQKMNAVLADLQNCHSSTQSWPSIITGLERELVISKILKLAIPNSYRIGKGVIIDSNNAQTGEVDIVIEVPLSPSFPITDGESRLYLAEGVGTTIEVKSDFRRQKKNAMEKNYEIKRLHRIPASSNNRNEIHAASYFYIPNYLIF